MNDTNEKMQKIFNEMMMKKTNEERLIMGCSMFTAAKIIVRSSILEKNPDITENELRVKLFLRFYGLDFTESEKEKIIQHLMTHTAL